MKTYEKVCEFCGDDYTSKSKKSKYCSKSCLLKNFRRNLEPTIKLSCDNCGEDLFRKQEYGHEHNFCSLTCSLEYRYKNQTKESKCERCGNSFTKRHSNHKFCSSKCKREHNEERVMFVETECSFCKGKISRRKNLIGKQNFFCSRECEKGFRKSQSSEIRKCGQCNKDFEVSKSEKKIFCSMKCQSLWQKTIKGKEHPS
jgi:hypothetical protein